jgi:hypothetical protein
MFELQPIPESHVESSEIPTTAGTTHGERGPRLIITDAGGYSSSTRTGYWRWCAKCNGWKKGAGIMAAMMCPTCREMWA